jgi:hypothetical protein
MVPAVLEAVLARWRHGHGGGQSGELQWGLWKVWCSLGGRGKVHRKELCGGNGYGGRRRALGEEMAAHARAARRP